MLRLTIKGLDLWDSKIQKFVVTKDQEIVLEHSLVSLSKWEFIWEKPFLGQEKRTREEWISYIKCMTITQNISDSVYNRITQADIELVSKYIDKKASALTFKDVAKGGHTPYHKTMTSETIYYWMTVAKIPFIPCEKWHLNRLLTLIRLCNDKNNPRKMSKDEIYKQNRELNKQRRAKLNSKG